MRKKLFAALIVAVIAMFAGYNIYQSQRAENTMSELALANVEALAGTEDTLPYNCYYGGCSYNPNWDCFTTVDGYLYYCANMKTYR